MKDFLALLRSAKNHALPILFSSLIVMAWLAHVARAQTWLSSPVLTNFFLKQFLIDPAAARTNVIQLKLNSEQFDWQGDTITVTNVFGPNVTNIFQTFITSNIFVTNITVVQIIVSNIVAGNIHGTTNTLAMFFPDSFSVGDSIVTQNSDTNGVTVNGAGEAYIIFGPGTTNVLERSANALYYTNQIPRLGVKNGANEMSLLLFGSTAPHLAASSTIFVDQPLVTKTMSPDADNTHDIGANSSIGAYKDSYFKGVQHAVGFNDGAGNSSWADWHHTGTNGLIVFDTESSGSAGPVRNFVFTNAIVQIHKNVAAQLNVGDTTFVDMSHASQTNSVVGAIAFAHATNGVDLLDLTHVRWLFNGSGSDQTLTIPAAWRTNVYSAVPPALTNNTITKMILNCGGDISTAAKQTNVYVSFEYFK